MRSRSVLTVSLCALTLALTISAAAAEPSPEPAAPRPDVSLPQIGLMSVAGGKVSLPSLAGEKATVAVFLATECPISNGYLPTLNRLHTEGKARGVAVIGLQANAGQSLPELDKHRRDYDITFPVLRDAGGAVAQALGAEVAPTVCVFDAQGTLRYRGRIDDRYTARGKAAGATRQADLEKALAAVLAGQRVETPETEAIGCRLQFGPAAAKPAAADGPTFSRDISRLLQKNCQSCHRPEGVAPFSLLTYGQAVSWADDLVHFTADGSMPPWKPVAGHGEFNGERRMDQAEVKLLAQWVAAGCPEGDRSELPQPKKFAQRWQLGEPDVVLTPAEPFAVGADGPDIYQCFVLPTDFDGDRYVTALEVLPGNARLVHHVIAFVDVTGRSAELDQRDPGPGYATSQGFPGFFPSGGLGGWAPGNTPEFLPAGMARVLPKGARVVMQVHYHRTGKAETDQTRIGLHFSKVEVNRAMRTLPVGPPGPFSGMRIPAGHPNYEVRASRVVQQDILAVTVTPHMHLIGKDMQITATLPGGKQIPLVYIRDWDFNWQESYMYREPILLPRGTRIDLVTHFDNSAKNPRNPSSPPKEVRWGEQTTDEMCIGFLEVAPAQPQAKEDIQPPAPAQELVEAIRREVLPKLPRVQKAVERLSAPRPD